MTKPLAAVIALLIAGLTAVLFMMNSSLVGANHQINVMRDQLTRDRGLIDQLSSQVAGLTSPTDPLSAYNTVCNQPMLDSSTGLTQTYYFPCTNTAQTIPQPGN